MFTGIVEGGGEVVRLRRTGDAAVLEVAWPGAGELPAGSSVAVDGCCLTVLGPLSEPGRFAVDVMGETLARTTIGRLAPGDPVNLERPVAASGLLGGHLVQGHVDGTGEILERTCGPSWDTVRVGVPPDLGRYVAPKGSVAVDGVSLTVVDTAPPGETEQWFTVGLIPTTLRVTTLGRRRVGDPVNLEVDVIAKYVERLLGARSVRSAA